MEQALTLEESTRTARRALTGMLFTSPWAALAIPLLAPLIVLFF
jgi:hypothetical protein